MIGPELGLLDQELAKLALSAAGDKKITSEMVQKLVGGWRAKTTWDMLDLALEGKAAEALRQIDRLLAGGEAPVGLLAQISASLRRLATATRLILQAEAAGRRLDVGFRPGPGPRQQVLRQEGCGATPPSHTATRPPTLPLAAGGRSRPQG